MLSVLYNLLLVGLSRPRWSSDTPQARIPPVLCWLLLATSVRCLRVPWCSWVYPLVVGLTPSRTDYPGSLCTTSLPGSVFRNISSSLQSAFLFRLRGQLYIINSNSLTWQLKSEWSYVSFINGKSKEAVSSLLRLFTYYLVDCAWPTCIPRNYNVLNTWALLISHQLTPSLPIPGLPLLALCQDAFRRSAWYNTATHITCQSSERYQWYITATHITCQSSERYQWYITATHITCQISERYQWYITATHITCQISGDISGTSRPLTLRVKAARDISGTSRPLTLRVKAARDISGTSRPLTLRVKAARDISGTSRPLTLRVKAAGDISGTSRPLTLRAKAYSGRICEFGVHFRKEACNFVIGGFWVCRFQNLPPPCLLPVSLLLSLGQDALRHCVDLIAPARTSGAILSGGDRQVQQKHGTWTRRRSNEPWHRYMTDFEWTSNDSSLTPIWSFETRRSDSSSYRRPHPPSAS